MRSTHITKKNKATGLPLPCWCDYEQMNVCSESDPKGNCPKTCWRCQGRGLVPVYDLDLTVLLIHSEGQLTDG